MKISHIPMKIQKRAASILHLLFLVIMFCGIGVMYLNDNFGSGITSIKSVSYEDTDEFNEQVNQDLEDLLLYIEYNEVFGGGTIDASEDVLEMTFGPNETESFSLANLISYLQNQGYELDETFQYRRVSRTGIYNSRTGYVDWSASEPERYGGYNIPGTRRASLEEISLEIMDILHQYHSAYTTLVSIPSNLHYKIEYFDELSEDKRATIHTNDQNLTPATVKNYGRYAYLAGNSVFYDTNLKSLSLSNVSSLAASNPYNGNTFSMTIGLDTAYPVEDHYREQHSRYVNMQNHYIAGFVLLAAGGLGVLLTLLFLSKVSGHKTAGDRTVTLHNFDKTSMEGGIIFFSVLTGAALCLCRYIMVRLVHLVFAEDIWYILEQVLYTAVLYLGTLLLFFSLLRRYKAGILWSGSLFCRFRRQMAFLSSHQLSTRWLRIGFFGYLCVNSGLISLIWFLWERTALNKQTVFLLTALVIVVCLLFNLWIFYLLYRGAAEHDMIRTAIEHLAAGETSYQIDLSQFEGQDLVLAEGLNNISTGLETALQEKVKSERLKADLITNVSHDIKTPLTSILNYVDLIKREPIDNKKILGYLDVLEQKSLRLKTLTEDLVEASKASSGNVKLDISDIDLNQLIHQTNGEFEEKFASRRLEIITTAPEESLVIEADGRRLWRVLENLYNNSYKYAMEGSRVYVDVARINGSSDSNLSMPDKVAFTIKNISSNPLNIRPEELTERFVRGDVARTTEGSGLGLSIAKSLTELQNGQFDLFIDGDLFKAQITFLLKKPAKPTDETQQDAVRTNLAADIPEPQEEKTD